MQAVRSMLATHSAAEQVFNFVRCVSSFAKNLSRVFADRGRRTLDRGWIHRESDRQAWQQRRPLLAAERDFRKLAQGCRLPVRHHLLRILHGIVCHIVLIQDR